MSEDRAEEWRDIPDVPGFRASSLGRVRGKQRLLTGCPDRDGYLWVWVYGKPTRRVSVHHAVASAFIGPRPDGYDIDHLDGNKQNNQPDNLEYVTHGENMRRRAVRLGIARKPKATKSPKIPRQKSVPGHRYGARNGRSKLSEDQAREVLALYSRPERHGHGVKNPNGLAAIAHRYGVSKAAVHDLVRGKTWPHLQAGARK